MSLGTLVLENERCLLRPLELGDGRLLQDAAFSKPNLLEFSPSSIHTEELLQAYVDSALQSRTEGLRYPFIIFDKLHGKYAGSTSYGNPSFKDQRVEIGWTWIGSAFQRTGLNRNIKFLMLRYGFEVLDLQRIELKTDVRNMQSREAMKKIGAIEEGILRSHTVMQDGFRRDTIYYSILADEWSLIKSSIFQSFS
ncbi:MAG: GNAT family N-acetyltransferase [Bacteroidia bacterium]|nr:GNAT family N-acetyltransferase [Bacteroidia bacterium]